MKRRQFNQSLLLASAWGAAPLSAWALDEGRDYRRLAQKVPTQTQPGQIEVLEFFAYSCIHCFQFEAPFHAWMEQQASDVVVKRVPVLFSQQFVPMAKLYYSLEALGWLERLHGQVFTAIHGEKQRLFTDEAIAAWMKQQGADMKAFESMYTSFGVAGKVKRGGQLSTQFEVEGTPALGIQGQFIVPGQGQKTLTVADALIAQLRGQ
jgi:thiol:disulfide interchange protein DsbA